MSSDSICLDDVMAGSERPSVIVLATDSSLGHAFAPRFALDFATDHERHVFVCNFAAGARDMLSLATRPNVHPGGDLTALGSSASSLGGVRAEARRIMAQIEPPRLHFVDGLEPLWGKAARDPEEAGRVIEEIRTLAIEFDLTVVAVIPFSPRSTRRGAAGPSVATMIALEKADLALHFRSEEVYDWHATGQRVAEITVVRPSTGSGRTCKLDVTENLGFRRLPVAS